MKNFVLMIMMVLCTLMGLVATIESVFLESRRFIFVGGRHKSGTSVTERILSSQSFASGLDVYSDTVLNRTNSCTHPSQKISGTCTVQEHEGKYLTKEFQKLSSNWMPHCTEGKYWELYRCWQGDRLTKRDYLALGRRGPQIRSTLLQDWGMFWNVSKPYWIEKDIENMLRSNFLQEMFGVNRTAFIFTLRHPLSWCTHFNCPIEEAIINWINTYRIMERDLRDLDTYLVYHSEMLYTHDEQILGAIEDVLQLPHLKYEIAKEVEQLHRLRRLSYHGDRNADLVTIKSSQRWEDYYEANVRQDATVLKILQFYEADLAHFCYGIYNMNVQCEDSVWRKSERKLPAVKFDVNPL